MTDCLQKDPHSEKHCVWGRFEFRGPYGALEAQSQTLFFRSVAQTLELKNQNSNTVLLFQLFYEVRRPEETFQSPITSLTECQRATLQIIHDFSGGLHSFSHSSVSMFCSLASCSALSAMHQIHNRWEDKYLKKKKKGTSESLKAAEKSSPHDGFWPAIAGPLKFSQHNNTSLDLSVGSNLWPHLHCFLTQNILAKFTRPQTLYWGVGVHYVINSPTAHDLHEE